MKKMVCTLLAALLLFTGCQPAAPAETTNPGETVTPSVPEAQSAHGETMPGEDIVVSEGDIYYFQFSSKVRLDYTGDRSYVRYITSVDQLPDEEALKEYDEAFFEKSALVLVVETVSSGSVHLEIDSIYISEGKARVSLKRNIAGGEGTDDMATWMLWVEMEQGLDCEWILEGSGKQPKGEKY